MSLLEASLAAADYANLEPEVPDKRVQQKKFKEELPMTTGKLSEIAENASLEDTLEAAMKIKKKP